MKTPFLFLFVLLLGSAPLLAQQQNYSQNRRAEREKLESAKIAFITNRLNLTADQAKDFWPLYNEYEAKRLETRSRPGREAYRMTEGGKKELSDADAKKLMEIHFKAKEEDLEIEKSYIAKFSSILDHNQVLRLLTIDESFLRNYMMRGAQEGNRPGGGPPQRGGSN